jgi:hypothetical protein
MVVVLAITNALLGATIVALVGIGTGCAAQGLTAEVALAKRLLITGAQRMSAKGTSGLMRRSKVGPSLPPVDPTRLWLAYSFDHLVGNRKQIGREGKT